MPELPDAHFGTAETPLPNWRKDAEGDGGDGGDDDDELAKTPSDVVEMLGFDPLELEEHQIVADDLDTPDTAAEQATGPDWAASGVHSKLDQALALLARGDDAEFDEQKPPAEGSADTGRDTESRLDRFVYDEGELFVVDPATDVKQRIGDVPKRDG